jgi:hypothetical protein
LIARGRFGRKKENPRDGSTGGPSARNGKSALALIFMLCR